MSQNEIDEIRKNAYNEALRYMDNAKEVLRKAGKYDKFYEDEKYVKMACGTAYSALLIAVETYLKLKGIEKPKKRGRERIKVDFYTYNLGKENRKYLDYFNHAYEILHLAGYYDGVKKVDTIKSGFESAYFLIENLIKP